MQPSQRAISPIGKGRSTQAPPLYLLSACPLPAPQGQSAWFGERPTQCRLSSHISQQLCVRPTAPKSWPQVRVSTLETLSGRLEKREFFETIRADFEQAIVIRDVSYLPIFERIDREIAAFEKQEDLIQRAKAVPARPKPID